MSSFSDDILDEEMIRCPKLGGEVTFRYCRLEKNRLPCGWIIGCWQDRMDIKRFISENYTTEEQASIFAPPKPKILTLLEIIKQAQQVAEEKLADNSDEPC
ncbi:hypothetical protein ACFL27_01975 [candidate division CSSED10-310 bacterium]|uniref:Uncharacterized protein n=1 Tax=candidate division CSSED10-310 bacterium TaxID=2855610 RepID=A0ABV6YRX0_UNCC1